MQIRFSLHVLGSLGVCLALTACDPSGSTEAGPVAGSGQGVRDDFLQSSVMLVHDFGLLRLGSVAHHDFEVPIDRRHGNLIPLRFQVQCTCATSKFIIVAANGTERVATGQPFPQYAVREDEKLLLRVTLDTNLREAHDEPVASIPGFLVLQAEKPPYKRRSISVRIRFGIDSPVDIRPYAHLDLKQLPRSQSFSQTFELHCEDAELEYGEIRCVESNHSVPGTTKTAADLTAHLEQSGDIHLLHVKFSPAAERALGAFLLHVEIETNLDDDFLLRLPVSGRLVGDIEVSPPGMFSYARRALDKPADLELVITDYDKKRPAAFIVSSLVDANGVDLSSHFTVTFKPLKSRPRTHRIRLRYLGTLGDRRYIRGKLNLAKESGGEHVHSIDITAFSLN